jgi:hypothetical protein
MSPVGEREGRTRSHESLESLGDQPTGARARDFGEWIVDFVLLPERDNSILKHEVTFLREVQAGLVTNRITPPSSHRHPDSAIAQFPKARRSS